MGKGNIVGKMAGVIRYFEYLFRGSISSIRNMGLGSTHGLKEKYVIYFYFR
jgi:hypothetical protein